MDLAIALEEAVEVDGKPDAIKLDNGPEFISKEVDLWAYHRGVTLDFSRPGKPTDNAFIESFNGRFRQECLNQHGFLSLDDAEEKIGAWRDDDNCARPHFSLGNQTSEELAALCAGCIKGVNTGFFSFRADLKQGQAQLLLLSSVTALPSAPFCWRSIAFRLAI